MNGYVKMKYGLIGKKLSHSFSPLIHSLMGNNDYTLKELSEDELDLFFKKRDFLGINITNPYKVKVLKYLDEIDDMAKEIGCVNTVINQNNKLIGYNTDYYGLEALFKENSIDPHNKKCMILGTGGTCKTTCVLLKKLGAKEIIIVSRNPHDSMLSYEEASKIDDVQILINTTPRGMSPNNEDDLLIDLCNFKTLEAVVDVIYNPLNTKLIVTAKEKNIKAIGGLKMLVEQAKYADKLFFNRYELKCFDESVVLKKCLNVVLIGMPYAGKSTIAKQLSKMLNYTFVDFDDEIKKISSDTIENIIKTHGEEHFRKIESTVCKKYAPLHQQVISTGGGIIENIENILLLKQNGIIIYLSRDERNIKFDNSRPLASSLAMYKNLYSKRKSIYEKYADIIVDNNSTLEECLRTIYSKLEDKMEV